MKPSKDSIFQPLFNERIEPLAIQKYIRQAQTKSVISFAAGLPDMSVLPIQKLHQYYREMDLDIQSFQYQSPLKPLKIRIQELMKNQGLTCSLDEILITSGAQQGIYLSAQLFFRQNARLIMEEFVYPGFLQIANMFNLEYSTIPFTLDDELNLDKLESLLKSQDHLSYLYMVCNGNNPLGTTMNTQSRKDLAHLAEKYDCILIEDDPYGYLSFTDEKYLPLRAYTNNAIYLGSFSKIIGPSLRTGWVVADKAIIEKMNQLKDMNDLYASTPSHLMINRLLENHSIEEITQIQKSLYKDKLHCMTETLNRYLKIPFRYRLPKHGMFIWLEFPEHALNDLHENILEEAQVLYIPAQAFSPSGACEKHAMRLNFTYPSFDQIETGIQKLCETLNHLEVHAMV